MGLRRLVWLLLLLAFVYATNAQMADLAVSTLFIRPRDRISRTVDDEERIALRGDVHPSARSEYDRGAVSPDYRMPRMILLLKPDEAQQGALDALLKAQHDPASAYYHQWLTPESYGKQFGISERDLAEVTNWLQSHGLSIDEVAPSRRLILFSGNAAQVLSAFHTPIRNYRIANEVHHANGTAPEIPEALSDVIGGVLSLHDFRTRPQHSNMRNPVPEFTSGSSHYVGPADLSVIYNIDPLYEQGIDGSGQTVAIVGRSNFKLSDVRLFRSMFGLPENDPEMLVNGTNPGILNADEEAEALLDVEWSGAIARNATIKYVLSASTSSSDGVYLSSQYAVNHNVAPVMSVSFGLCEAALGRSGNSFINSLWQQAASQGITVFVASGDSGAAGCDSPSAARALKGKGVNGLCSSPYSVCVGGTQFDDGSNASLYWSSSNTQGRMASAFGYIPETAWNESSTRGLWATGGGPSSIYSKPAWQKDVGMLSGTRRDTPDVSFTAAAHDGYLVVMHGGLSVLAGTSASSPSWAGLMAMAVQKTGKRQGNANPALYTFASRQRGGGPAVFHDVAKGGNSVPGVTGYSAAAGYDLATGLGSPDASVLISHWNDPVPPPTFTFSPSAKEVSLSTGKSATVILRMVAGNSFNAAISLSVSGLPVGTTATFIPAKIVAPGNGSSKLTLKRKAGPAGTSILTVTAAGGTITRSAKITLIRK
jgi:pseudomonalisin